MYAIKNMVSNASVDQYSVHLYLSSCSISKIFCCSNLYLKQTFARAELQLVYSRGSPSTLFFFFNKNKLNNKNTEAEIAQKNKNKLRTD